MGTSSFSSFKKSESENFDKLRDQLNKTKNGDRQNDDRFWQPDRGKDGNDYCVLRFLPAPPNEEVPYVKTLSYGFKGPGGWYIENSRGTIGEDDDPVDKMRRALYATGTEADKKIAQKYSRRTNFISNIEIIDYPKHPEMNGKQFLYRYGKKIFDKINDCYNPKFPDEPKFNPFNFWEGADFVLKVTTQDDFPNYDKSEFKTPAPHRGGGDAELEAIWKNLYSLQAFIDPSQYKPAKDLQKRLNKVLGLDTELPEPEKEEPKETSFKTDSSRFDKAEVPGTQEVTAAKVAATNAEHKAKDSPPWAGDADDELDYFKNAAKG